MPRSHLGFTLIEVLVAISIIAVVSAVTIPNLHKYNQTQLLKNTAQDLAVAIQTAQNNGRSGVKCPSGKFPQDWDLYVRSDGYYYRAHCIDLVSGSIQTESTASQTIYFPSGISASSSSCTLPQGINYSSNTISYDCGYQGTFLISLKDSELNTSTIQIDGAGNVSVN